MSGALGTVEVISLNPSSDPVPICMEDLPDIQDISPVSTIVGALGTTFGKGASIKYVRRFSGFFDPPPSPCTQIHATSLTEP